MALSKIALLEKAVEITKEYARSGATNRTTETVLKFVYEELKKINEDLDK